MSPSSWSSSDLDPLVNCVKASRRDRPLQMLSLAPFSCSAAFYGPLRVA